MSTLSDILKRHGVDVTALHILCDTGHHKIYRLVIDGAGAIDFWKKMRELVEETGYWPVLLGDGQTMDWGMFAGIDTSEEPTTADLIASGAELDPQTWFDHRVKEDPDYFTYEEGSWPSGDHSRHHFSIPFDTLTKKPLPEVYLAFVPTKSCWEVPAFLRFGGWNDCPQPEEHVCLLKWWHDEYGIEVVGMLDDVLELRVGCPPTTPEAARKLAYHHFVYCLDIVDQDARTLENLAATLLNASVWYFWWA